MFKKALLILTSLILAACDQQPTPQIDEEFTLPPLTFIQQFESCPFEVAFPNAPTTNSITEENERYGLIIEPYFIFAECYSFDEDVTLNTDKEFVAENFLMTLEKENLYQSINVNYHDIKNYKLHNSAVLEYSAHNSEIQISGILFVHNTSVAVMHIMSNTHVPNVNFALDFFQSLTLKTNN